MRDYVTCCYCGQELNPRYAGWHFVEGRLFPFHRSLLHDCMNEFLKAERQKREAMAQA